jgi:ribose transport system ATP-binding protein
VVVLRDGRNAGELAGEDIRPQRIVSLMVGRDVSLFQGVHKRRVGETALQVEHWRTAAHPQHPLSFHVKSGEIVGIAGLVGAGRTELLQSIFGVEPARGGQIQVKGQPTMVRNPQDAIRAGLALVPEDRKEQGLILAMTVQENIGLAALAAKSAGGFLINFREERRDAQTMIDRLRLRPPNPRAVVQNLSGGNQQKVVLAKWLLLNPAVLLLDEPTRGVDVGAKEEMYNLIEKVAESGAAVLFVSSEMPEVLGLADRILVMHEGRITGELARANATEQRIMQLATGQAVGPH